VVIRAEISGGTILEFPDGTPQDVIQTAVRNSLDIARPATPEGVVTRGPQAGQPSVGLQRATAITQGATLGLQDEIQGLFEGVGALVTGGDFGTGFEEGRTAAQETFQTAQEERPLETLGLTLAGGLPAGAAGGLRAAAAAKGAGAGRGLQAAAAGVPAGAIGGAGFADAETVGQAAAGAGIGAATGAAIGPVVGAAGRFFTRPMKPTTPSLLGDVEEGVTDLNRINQLQEVLGTEAKSLNKRIGTAFDKAQDVGNRAFVDQTEASRLANSFRTKAAETIDDEQRQVFANAATRIEGLSQKGNVTVNEIQGLRRAATSAATSGGSKGNAAGNVKGSIDEFLDDAIEAGTVKGDKSAVADWKKAIGLRREYGQRFEASNFIKKAITEGETPETISQQLLGGKQIGTARNASKLFDDVVKAAGTGNKVETESLLKQSVVSKMFRNAERAGEGGNELVWIKGLANQIRGLRRDNPSLFKKFSSSEMKQFNKLEQELRKATEPGVLNKVLDFSFNILNKNPAFKVTKPTTFDPQQLASVDEIIKLMATNPKTPIRGGVEGVTGVAAGLAGGELAQALR